MNKNALRKLLVTQFLSAMADNMVLMATIQIITSHLLGNVYVGIVQACFFIAYAVLAPYAGILSERVPKATVLWMGNIIKIVGACALFAGINPAVAYAIVGIGACVYGPGKYAILKEITDNENALYRSNGMVEGSTIVAILIGTVAGSFLASHSMNATMAVVLSIYALSFLFAWLLPKGATQNVSFNRAWRSFATDIGTLTRMPKVKSTIVGTSAFWMASSVVRLAVIAWVPIAYGLAEDQASLFMGLSAIGIMAGAIFSPKLMPLHKLGRLIFFGSAMAAAIGLVGWIPSIPVTVVLLFICGFSGGAFMIPLNTVLQEKGKAVGNGKTIAIQNFFENVAMVSGTLIYSGALHIGFTIPLILAAFALIHLVIVLFVQRDFSAKAKADRA